MAKFNNQIFGEEAKRDINEQQQCTLYLQACLPEEDYVNLKAAWKEAGGVNTIPWWKFVFDNVEVKYSKK